MNTSLKLITLTFVLLGITSPLRAQEPTAPSTFTSDRLEQMAAPIALYPDALVAQILMASTYPLEVVEAARWVEQNPDLQGPALEEALKQQEWDPSVKALCGFPTVLKLMNENLTWTRDLGDAFLVQQAELMDTIQVMRRKALEAGNLETTEQQQVTQEERIIVIQPTNPEVIYVPVYSPVVVYGPSWYCPTWYYPGCYAGPSWGFHLSFGIGCNWGWGLWGGCNWIDHCCHVVPQRFNCFNSRTCFNATFSNFPTTAGHSVAWQHNPGHRAGVAYRSQQVARQFGAAPGSNRVQADQRRGIEQSIPLNGGDLGRATRTLVGQPDSPSRPFSSRNDRDRSDAVDQMRGSGPSTSRVIKDPAPVLSPITPSRGVGTPDGARTDVVVGNSGRGSKAFERGEGAGGTRSEEAVGSGTRSAASPERGRAGGVVSGSGRSEGSSGGGSRRDRGSRGGGKP